MGKSIKGLASSTIFDKPIENVKGKLSFWNYDLERGIVLKPVK